MSRYDAIPPVWALARSGSQPWGEEHVYTLPLNAGRIGVPLHEHSAFLLATALLHDDLDDSQDAVRGAFEIDPLLAAWAVCAAAKGGGSELKSLDAACRWTTTSMLGVLGDPTELLQDPLPAAVRATWRKISVTAVTAGRIAQTATQPLGVQARHAFWRAMICSTKRQFDELAKRNGRSPLRGFTLTWPRWVQQLDTTIGATTSGDSRFDARLNDAISVASDGSRQAQHVSAEEQALWYRPYPEFRHLVPLMLEKLQRMGRLEEHFEETLQNEKLASLQQLAYGAGHEINNPLANISTRAQTLVCNEHDADRRKKLLAINDQAFRAYEMIADLMLFAKPPSIECKDVSICELLTRIRDELGETHPQFEVELNLPDAPLPCFADPVQLSVAFTAICKNGFEAMGDGGCLTIEASRSELDATLKISIEDTGCGFDETTRKHLFDPFFSGREAGRGLGFGLSKAWRIVQQHHGRIMVHSRLGRGSRFTVILSEDRAASDRASTITSNGCDPANTHEQRSASVAVQR